MINYNDIVSTIKDEMRKDDDKWEFYERSKIASGLPIDLFWSKEKGYNKDTENPEMD